MMGYLFFWGARFVIAVIAELVSLQVISIWFAVGAAGAFTATLFDVGFTGQLAIFVLVSVFLLLITRPLMAKIRVKNAPAMNADKDIGKSAVVIEEINALRGTGRVRINGVDWIALSESGEMIAPDTVVTVTDVQGAKLIVRV